MTEVVDKLELQERKLEVTVQRNYGPVTIAFTVSALVMVDGIATQHAEFEKLLAQLEFEQAEYSRTHLLKKDSEISKQNKTPGGNTVSLPAVKATKKVDETGTHYSVFAGKWMQYGIPVYKEHWKLANIEEVMGDQFVKDLTGWTVHYELDGKGRPKVVGLTKD